MGTSSKDTDAVRRLYVLEVANKIKIAFYSYSHSCPFRYDPCWPSSPANWRSNSRQFLKLIPAERKEIVAIPMCVSCYMIDLSRAAANNSKSPFSTSRLELLRRMASGHYFDTTAIEDIVSTED